jgi:hypothetical protein
MRRRKKIKFRGHKIECENNIWIFCENGKPVKDVWKEIGCGYCGKKDTAEGHDNCLGTLPKAIVMNACCGHGQINEAYIQFLNGTIIKGKLAKIIMLKLKYKEEKENETN